MPLQTLSGHPVRPMRRGVLGSSQVVVDEWSAKTKPQALRTLGCAILGVYGLGECASSAIVVSS